MKVLIADSLGAGADAALVELGIEVSHLEDSPLTEAVRGHDALIVRSTKVDEEVLAGADSLGLVVRAGAGTDTIDVQAAARRGIFVCNVPGRNAVAVAELTMGLLVAIDRRIVDGALDLRRGRWDKSTYKSAGGLAGKTMGIIGLGSIGLAVAKRASAFDMQVLAVRKPSRSAETEKAIRSLGVSLVDSREELLGMSDVVSVHVPGGPETDGLVNGEFLQAMNAGAILLNTSRGSTIDGEALLSAIESRGIRAGLDVFPDEPSSGSADYVSELSSHPSVVGSHHIGASTDQAQQSILEGTVEVLAAYQRGDLLNCVNLQRRERMEASLVIRHVDKVGVLAEILSLLRTAGINVQEMNNRVFAGATAAVATIEVSPSPDEATIDEIRSLDPVFGVLVQDAT